MENMEMPQQNVDDAADNPAENQDDAAAQEARVEARKKLGEAREFVDENAEVMKKAVTDVVEAYNEHQKKWEGKTARPDFDIYDEAFQAFHKNAVIREFFERYNAGDDQVKRLLMRDIAETFDTATDGKPYQYLLRRRLLHLVPSEVTDEDDRRSKTQEEFETNMERRGLNTTYSPEGTKFIAEYSEFFETSGKSIVEAFSKAAQSAKLEEWFDPRRSSGLKAAEVATMLGEDFYNNEHVVALKDLYERAKYVERDSSILFVQEVSDWIQKSRFHSKEQFGEIKIRDAILDHEPRRR